MKMCFCNAMREKYGNKKAIDGAEDYELWKFCE